jgi:predicted DNA-binding transcriptional regulator YafY
MAQMDYLLSIMWLLKSNDKITAEKMAEILELSVRTIYRYIDVLCTSGVPIVSESGHGGGYKLLDSFSSYPLFFDNTELKAMAHCALLARQTEYPFADALERALEKIEHQINDSQLEDLRRHAASLEVIEWSRSSSLQAVLHDLEQAIADSKSLTIHYKKAVHSSKMERFIDPYGLIYRLHQEREEASVTVNLQGNEAILDQICNQWFLQPYLDERSV